MTKPEWLSGRLREMREALNWSRDVLAERSGVPIPTIRDIERGERMPGWPIVISLAEALGVGVEAFTHEPAPRDPPGPGRPKQVPLEPPAKVEPAPKRGRPKKPPTEAQDEPAGEKAAEGKSADTGKGPGAKRSKKGGGK